MFDLEKYHSMTADPYDDPDAAVEYSNMLDDAVEEIKELRAFIDKLPKTDDMVPVIPGLSKVWRINSSGHAEESINWEGWGALFMSELENDGYWPKWSPEKCYSTKAAAEAAREKQCC